MSLAGFASLVRLTRRQAASLRAGASALAVAVCGYLSLGTSCDDIPTEEQATGTLRFAPGQASATFKVRAEASWLVLHFDEELVVLRAGKPTPSPQGGAPSDREQMTCGPGHEPPRRTTVPAEGTTCSTERVSSEEELYEVVRSDTTAALEVAVTAIAGTYTDCDGHLKGTLGVMIEVEEP